MATYLILNGIFLVAVLLMFRVRPRMPSRAWWATLCILIVATAVFDSLLVGLDIVAYDASKILGVYIGRAPAEDFFYAILAVVMVPKLWNYFTKQKA